MTNYYYFIITIIYSIAGNKKHWNFIDENNYYSHNWTHTRLTNKVNIKIIIINYYYSAI